MTAALPPNQQRQRRSKSPAAAAKRPKQRSEAAEAPPPLELGRYCKIDGRFYRIDAFKDKHPGGRLALRCAEGRDATPMFESYHGMFRASALRALRELEVKDEVVLKRLRAARVFESGDSYDWAARDSPFVRLGLNPNTNREQGRSPFH